MANDVAPASDSPKRRWLYFGLGVYLGWWFEDVRRAANAIVRESSG